MSVCIVSTFLPLIVKHGSKKFFEVNNEFSGILRCPGEGRSPAAWWSTDAVVLSRSRLDTEHEEVAKKGLGRHNLVCSSPEGGGNNSVRISLTECLRTRRGTARQSPLQFHPSKQNRHREPNTRMKQHHSHGWVTHAHSRGLCARLGGGREGKEERRLGEEATPIAPGSLRMRPTLASGTFDPSAAAQVSSRRDSGGAA